MLNLFFHLKTHLENGSRCGGPLADSCGSSPGRRQAAARADGARGWSGSAAMDGRARAGDSNGVPPKKGGKIVI